MGTDRPLELSRYCIPFTPFTRKLEEATVCLVTTAAVRSKGDKPFVLEGDSTYRVIARSEGGGADLAYDDAHYDHACVDQDINCVFPLDRLEALARDGRIGAVADRHFSLGFTQALRELRESTLPALVREVDTVRPDAVLLTGG